ncbi:hypothetical protein M3P05_14430 [Sansalvadorimonas sp. 2012CJ34-2]|uniref:Desulfoferrodoxin ferrous iron-binding domain-containing protein n=1 Tax=Parendozoicomonas callyspongiae TaxID=2942213 RepID=A0ABT0PIB8_9GAMM|nr:desulfoferrodoxin family protein [Sansalvadorimonas sp. 2012CJ34-2]MCL6271119.1 hypothetical protein [Sansalvadorimonas sp. 2012CJ34-2]
MNRRNLLKAGLAGSAAGLIYLPSTVRGDIPATELAGKIYFTEANPGRWSHKAQTHLPRISTARTGDNLKITVTTPHEMKPWEHYIVKHQLLDKNFNLLFDRIFNPEKDTIPVSEFILGTYSGSLYALSMCNKHDVWLGEITI